MLFKNNFSLIELNTIKPLYSNKIIRPLAANLLITRKRKYVCKFNKAAPEIDFMGYAPLIQVSIFIELQLFIGFQPLHKPVQMGSLLLFIRCLP